MGLNDKDNSAIRDLKATFFDVFSEHTEELVKIIEALATDQALDAVKMESVIFQRIIMLNKAIGNIKDLAMDIEDLNSVKGNSTAYVAGKETKMIANGSMDKSLAQTDKPQTTTAKVEKVVQTPSTVVNGGESAVPKAVQATPVSKTESVVAPSEKTVTVNNIATADIIPSTKVAEKAVAQPQLSASRDLPPVKTENTPAKKPTYKFIKNSDKKVKAILVNERQYRNLKASFSRQIKLLNFSGAVSSNVKIEDLMKKASALYKEGKVAEAQALYSEISALNKKIQSQGQPNVLIKKAA